MTFLRHLMLAQCAKDRPAGSEFTRRQRAHGIVLPTVQQRCPQDPGFVRAPEAVQHRDADRHGTDKIPQAGRRR